MERITIYDTFHPYVLFPNITNVVERLYAINLIAQQEYTDSDPINYPPEDNFDNIKDDSINYINAANIPTTIKDIYIKYINESETLEDLHSILDHVKYYM